MIMKIVDIAECIRITMENDWCGMEACIDIGSKIQITFNSGMTFTGYVQRLEHGRYPDESDLLFLKTDDGTLYSAMVCFISDIKEL